MEKSFKDIGLDDNLINALACENIEMPTAIQDKVFSLILDNKDIIAEAETGSGKTLAYLLPLFQRLQPVVAEQQVLILVPTHELAIQVNSQIDRLAKNSGIPIKGASIIGNASIDRQIEKLKVKPQIIIGSAGRVLELIKRKKIKAHTIKTIIIDEADKLFDINNLDQIKAVIKCTLKERQIALFSASIPQETINKAKAIMKEPEFINVSNKNKIPESIKHICFLCEKREKLDLLRKVTRILNPNKAMVFINKAEDIELATEKLIFHKLTAKYIHGTSPKIDRKNAIEAFKNNKVTLLVASDMAARGLHFDDVDMVFHVTISQNPTDYLHRSGRTGRNGKAGLSISIISEEDIPYLQAVEREYGIEIDVKDMYNGKIIDKE